MQENKHEGIPTIYHGRRFRSRLEARWAAMFALLAWEYEYEPYDLKGWIPDFALFGVKEIIVEVKPYSSLEEFDTGKILGALKGTEKWGKEILLLGSTIWESTSWGGGYSQAEATLGFLGEFWEKDEFREEDEYCFDGAVVNHYEKRWGFFHETGCYEDRITGLYEGNHYLSPASYQSVLELWNEAGNIVQYKRSCDDGKTK